jgi:hypothetical protein
MLSLSHLEIHCQLLAMLNVLMGFLDPRQSMKLIRVYRAEEPALLLFGLGSAAAAGIP